MNRRKLFNTGITRYSYTQIGFGKRMLFSLMLLLIAAGILLLAEVTLRLVRYGGDFRLFIPAPEEVSDYYRCNPDIGKRYFYQQFTIPNPPKDLFLKEKPENGYRIFVLGGSTTAGFPYGNNLMFSRILWRRLQDAFPEKRIEVVNTAMAAVNSYAMLDFIDEILEYEPDLILIYAGHNEFYGALGVGSLESLGQNRLIIKIYLKMQHLRLFRLLRALISHVKSIFRQNHASYPEDFTATLMERIVSEQVIPLGSELYEQGKEQFRSNVEEILQKVDVANVPVVWSELVSNVGDQVPFNSVQSDTFSPAEEVYAQAQQRETRGDYNEARQLYLRAKDLDALRFRATEEFNTIIHDLASMYKVPVVPMRRIFEEQSSHGIIGNNLMIDHLHPNVDGYFLMADGFFETLRAEGYISLKWDSSCIKPVALYRKDWGMTALDTIFGNLSIYWLKGGWPFQPKEFRNTTLDTYTPKNKVDSMALGVLVGKEVGVEVGHLNLAHYYEDQKKYMEAYREYRALIYTIPHEVMFYEGAVQMLLKLNREEEAISILKESLRIRKNDFAIKWVSRLRLQQGKIDEALFYLDKVEPALEEDSEFLNTFAHAYIASGQFDRFRKVLEQLQSRKVGALLPFQYRVSAKTQHLAQQYNSASTVFLKERDFFTALLLLNQSLDIEETAFADKWVGQILLLEKNFHEALPYLKKAETMGLKDADLYYNLAAASYYLNKKKEAVRYLTKLKRIRPYYPDPSDLKGKLNPD